MELLRLLELGHAVMGATKICKPRSVISWLKVTRPTMAGVKKAPTTKVVARLEAKRTMPFKKSQPFRALALGPNDPWS